MKCVELLWRGLATRETPDDSTRLEAPGRVLLREVLRIPDARQWDLLVSPHAWLTLSLTDSLTEGDPAAFLRLTARLRECATGIDWPTWIPNDESLPAADTSLPDDVDTRVWSALRNALLSALPLEEDQVYYGLDLALLELDSIDLVMILSDLEDELGITIPDDRMDDLIPTRGTLGSAYERLVELADRQSA
jgi:acyl carrier protein